MNKMYMAAPKPDRFRGTLRHYHRSSQPAESLADVKSGRRSALLWLKVLGIVLGVIALIAIISGLFIELSA